MTIRRPVGAVSLGAVHHTDYLKLSAPMTTAEHRRFLRAEIEAMAELGLNCYNLNLAWGDLEVEPGTFDWERTDAAAELCRAAGLPLNLWLFAEVTPHWFARDHPGAVAVAATGARSVSHSYGSAEARHLLRRYIHAAVGRYGDADQVVAYNVGVETGFFWLSAEESSDAGAKLWDYNAEVVAGFRSWLATKYGSVTELNRFWRGHHRTIDEVEPPRRRYIAEQFMMVNQVPWLDWRLYMSDVLASYVHFKAACVRELHPDAVIGSHSFEIDPAVQGQDVWRINDDTDVVGTSMFVGPGGNGQIEASYWHDYFRSAARGKDYWVWELRCDQDAWGLNMWGPRIGPEDVGRYTWQALGHEAKGVQFWNWRPHVGGIEAGGHGLVDRAGEPTDRSRRVGTIASVLRRDGEWLRSARLRPARIAILDPRTARVVAAGEGSDGLITASQLGAYGLFRAAGHRVDFLHEDRLDEEELQRYRLVVIPLGYALPRRTAARLATWVADGGHLLAGLWCGAKDEFGFGEPHVPGLGLHDVFAAEQVGIDVHHDGDDERASPLNIRSAPLGQVELTVAGSAVGDGAEALTFSAFSYSAPLRPAVGAEAIVTRGDGACVGTRHAYGRGQAIVFGFPLVRHDHFAVDGLSRLVSDLTRAAGIEPPATVVDRGGEPVQVDVLDGGGGRRLLVVLNAGDRRLDLHVRVPGPAIGAARDAESGAHMTVSDPHTVVLSVDARDGRGILLRAEGS